MYGEIAAAAAAWMPADRHRSCGRSSSKQRPSVVNRPPRRRRNELTALIRRGIGQARGADENDRGASTPQIGIVAEDEPFVLLVDCPRQPASTPVDVAFPNRARRH